jgi:hypothetical protein
VKISFALQQKHEITLGALLLGVVPEEVSLQQLGRENLKFCRSLFCDVPLVS